MVLTFSLYLPRDGTSVPFVRHLCRSALMELAVETVCIDDIELALAEACTNVLRHAADSDDEYVVVLRIEDDTCSIEVVDAGDGFDHSKIPDSMPEGAESGRGIHLMRALVDDLQFVSDKELGTVVRLKKTLVVDPSSPLRRRSGAPEEAVGS
jgi:serine/threonine-protein kinase RsbW